METSFGEVARTTTDSGSLHDKINLTKGSSVKT